MSKIVRRHSLDPDGSANSIDWIYVIVAAPTGVMYESQCGGLAHEQRSLEGYLVPVMGAKLDASRGTVSSGPLDDVFHPGGASNWGEPVGADQVAALKTAVAEIPFWTKGEDGTDSRRPLALDEDRTNEILEAWVPVLTPEGRGILVWGYYD